MLENTLNDITNDISDLKVGGLIKHFLRTHVYPCIDPPKIILFKYLIKFYMSKANNPFQNISSLKHFKRTTKLVSILMNPFQLLAS